MTIDWSQVLVDLMVRERQDRVSGRMKEVLSSLVSRDAGKEEKRWLQGRIRNFIVIGAMTRAIKEQIIKENNPKI